MKKQKSIKIITLLFMAIISISCGPRFREDLNFIEKKFLIKINDHKEDLKTNIQYWNLQFEDNLFIMVKNFNKNPQQFRVGAIYEIYKNRINQEYLIYRDYWKRNLIIVFIILLILFIFGGYSGGAVYSGGTF